MVILLIFLSALPDALIVPVLKDLFVDRYGVSAAEAQMFLAVNLCGALLAIPLVRHLRRRMPGWAVVSATAIADGILLIVMWLPIGFTGTLVIRAIEGAADVATFAALFQMLGRVDRRHRALKLGLGATVLVAGLGMGAVLGGILTKLCGTALSTLLVGSISCVATGVLAMCFRNPLTHILNLEPASAPPAFANQRDDAENRALWPILLMAATDRATGAILTAVFASFFLSGFGYTASERGMLVGMPLLLMAIGAAPAGWAADRFGPLRLRTLAAIAYAMALAMVPFLGGNVLVLAAALLVLGVAAAPLLPASLALIWTTGRGMAGLAAFRAAGDIGYFTGIVVAVAAGELMNGGEFNVQVGLVCGFAGLHALVTAVAWIALQGRRFSLSSASVSRLAE